MGIFSSIANKFKEGVAGVKDVLQGKSAIPKYPLPPAGSPTGVFAQVAEKKLQPAKSAPINPSQFQVSDDRFSFDLPSEKSTPSPKPNIDPNAGILGRLTSLQVPSFSTTPTPKPKLSTDKPVVDKEAIPTVKEMAPTQFDVMEGPAPSSPRFAWERTPNAPKPKSSPSLEFTLTPEGETYIKSKYGPNSEIARNSDMYERIEKFKKSEDFRDTVSEIGVSLAQILPKALAAPVLDVVQKGEWTPNSAVAQVVFGDKPVESLQRKVDNSVQSMTAYLKSKGINNNWSEGLAVGFAPLFVSGMEALDLSPVGGAGKKVGKASLEIAALSKADDIMPHLRGLFQAGDDVLLPIAKNLEKVSDEKEVGKILSTLMNEKDLFKAAVPEQTALQKVSGVLAEGQQQLKDAEPSKVKEWLKKISVNFYDKLRPMNKFEGEIEKELGRKLTPDESAYTAARLASGVGGKIEAQLNDFSNILKTNPEAIKSGNLSNYLFAQRAAERARLGFKNPGDLTGEEAMAAIEELKQTLGPEKFKALEQSAVDVYKYTDSLLKYMVDNKYIDQATFNSIKAKNQFYTPFDVVDYLIKNMEEAGRVPNAKKAFSVAEQKLIQTTKGTTQNIDDPLNSIVRRTISIFDTIERNNVARKIASMGKEMGEENDLVLNLVDPVKIKARREAFRELPQLRQEFDSIKESLRITNTADSKVVSRIRDLQEDIDDLSEEAIELFTSAEVKEDKKLVSQIISIKNDASKAVKQLAKEAENIKEQNIVRDTRVKERVRVLDQDIAEAEKLVARAKDNNSLEKAQEKLLTSLQEKEKTLEEGKILYAGAPTPEPIVSTKLETIIPDAKKAIETNLIKKNNREIEALKARIANRETQIGRLEDTKAGIENTLDDLYENLSVKKKQIKSVLQDIKDNADRELPEGYERISYIEDGIKSSVAVPKEIGESLKRLGAQDIDMVTKGMSLWGRALRGGATTFNAPFIFTNIIRDFTSATLVAKHGFNPIDFAKGAWQGIKGIAREKGFNVSDDVFQEYLKAGGNIGGYYSTYLNDIPKTVKDLSKSQTKELLRLLNPFHLISTFGKVSERGTRLGVYMKALSKGASKEAAAMASRDATVDFSKNGEVMKVINMWVPFLNARLQGTVNIGKALKDSLKSPKEAAKMAAKIGGLAIAPFTAAYLWNQSRYPEVWDDISDYEKANNTMIILGDHQDEAGNYDQVIKVPKGSFNYFIDPVQDVLEYIKGNNPDLLQSLAADFIGNISPLGVVRRGNVKDTTVATAVNTTPPALKGLIETYTNKNTFTGNEIVRGDTMQQASPENQYYDYTSNIAKKVGEWLNISPALFENWIHTTFAGVGREVLGLGGTVANPGLTNSVGSDIIRRFRGAVGGKKQGEDFEEIKKLKTEDADKALMIERTAEASLRAIANASSDEELAKIIEDIQANPDVKEKMSKIITKEAKNLEPIMEAAKRLTPESRAKYIKKKMDEITDPKELQIFVSQLKAAKLFTKETSKAFAELIKSQ